MIEFTVIKCVHFDVKKALPVKRSLIAMTRNMIKHRKSCQDLAMARKHQDMYELVRSLHGYQETRSWQDFQERQNMTWQDIPSCKN